MLASPLPASPPLHHVLFDDFPAPLPPPVSSSSILSASSPDRPSAPTPTAALRTRERASSQLSTTTHSTTYSHSHTHNPTLSLSTAPTSHPSTILLSDQGKTPRVNKLEQEEIVLSVDLCKFHAGDRVPRDAFWRPRWEMANIHVALWTGLDQVYRHAPLVKKERSERLSFSRFAAAVVAAIGTHHDVEEEVYFPSLELKIDMAANIEQHSSFDDGLRTLKFYLRSCILDPSLYDATTVLDLIDAFAVELATHFADELNTLHPDILSVNFSTRELDKQGASLQKHIIKDYKRHLYTALPVLIINTPPGREWPLLSPLVRRILLPLILGRKYKTSWKYGKWPNQLSLFGSKPTELASSPPKLDQTLPIQQQQQLPLSGQQLSNKPSLIGTLSSFDASKPVRARVRSVSSKDVIGEWTAGVEKEKKVGKKVDREEGLKRESEEVKLGGEDGVKGEGVEGVVMEKLKEVVGGEVEPVGGGERGRS